MNIVFEGTEEQFENLNKLIKGSGGDLPVMNENYQTANLWQIEDVKSRFECTDDEAMEVLEEALVNEATMQQIWFAIDTHAQNMGLEYK